MSIVQKILYTGDVSISKAEEPLMGGAEKNYVLFPIVYEDIWAFYKNAEHTFWVAETLGLKEIVTTPPELSKMILLMHLTFDSPTTRILSSRISKTIQIQEARSYYGFQNMRTAIHLEAYSDILKAQSIDSAAGLEAKMNWVEAQITDKDCEFCKLVLVDAILRGVLCSGTLAVLGWMLKDDPISSAIRHIVHDLYNDVEFSYVIFKNLRKRIHPSSLTDMIKEAVGIEKEFVKSEIEPIIAEIGLDIALVYAHIQSTADKLAIGFGSVAIYDSKSSLFTELLKPLVKTTRKNAVKKQSLPTGALVFDEDF